MSLTRVVAITGCDRGLGWALAARSARDGLVTVAGMYHGTDTAAAQHLAKLNAHPYPLDVTDPNSVTGFRNFVISLLKKNPNYRLHAVVNNAGIMTIGDYEWQTPKMIEDTININLLGAMRVVSAFLPDLRKNAMQKSSKPRIINVASHCGLEPLPSFAVYSASKAALLAWTRALRLEHRTGGLTAVAFIPGGFVNSSGIMSNQADHSNAMLEHLNEEQKTFYERRIHSLTTYLEAAFSKSNYDSVNDVNIIETFIKALTDDDPKSMYKVESWRYMFYYNIFKLPMPEGLHHWLIKKFTTFPDGE